MCDGVTVINAGSAPWVGALLSSGEFPSESSFDSIAVLMVWKELEQGRARSDAELFKYTWRMTTNFFENFLGARCLLSCIAECEVKTSLSD